MSLPPVALAGRSAGVWVEWVGSLGLLGRSEVNQIINSLIRVSALLSWWGVPDSPRFAHFDSHAFRDWSETKDEMSSYLGRSLTGEEITCLSLSRCIGPCPSLTEAQSYWVMSTLWPKGNEQCRLITWSGLARQLESIL